MEKKGWVYSIFFIIPALLISCSSKKVEPEAYLLKKNGKPVIILKQGKKKKIIPVSSVHINEKDFPQLDKEDEAILYEESLKTGIKIPDRKEIRKFLYYYGKKNRKFTQEALNRASYYLPMIKKIFKEYGLPEELAYLPIIESGFDPYATSRSGAAGIWQFMRITGKRFGLKINRKIDERRDPYKSTIAAAKYLKYLYNYFGRWDLALAAYNCGEGCIQRSLSWNSKDFWDIKHKLPDQTRDYVPKFFAAVLIAKKPEKFGIKIRKREEYIVKTKKAKTTFSLKKFSRIYGIDYYLLKRYNAHLVKGVAYKGYSINIPVKKAVALKKKPEVKKVSYKKRYIIHMVKKGETLYRISKKYDVPVEEIIKANKIKDGKIKAGQVLRIPVKEVTLR
ncbi:MAG TPA: LysM peptidoglycan-binding domain-containing protein [Persephonella sp.]|uniref:Glycoside hydrolase family 23 n=1 Tax=Persephonella marina (strain DSM 14350 / EX-H1) TaxID=123214 RepID=C0QRI4_PERMH|nr:MULTISPECIES: lytic transglycosylase domain-containing protein [Persephonella]ACO04507.1 glycoside hydrolase family 23 [Persephonella marina EX-H1]HCB69025.1 LysM peptidoglycan-binding domain-containing protein [Persephonella sp.]